MPADAGERERIEELKAALAEATGHWPSTRSEHGVFASAVLQLAEVGATPEQVRACADRYRRRWPDVALTPRAIATHWSRFAADESGASKRSWIEKTSWQLDPDQAHEIVDEWVDVDDAERQVLHELVDQARANHQAASEAA